ncbi:MAG: hypothetical protein JF616_02240 [Fibrobacteres bacterium]|nr:hypothetical protein [Fibrobacterota bacterium]
MANRIAPGKWTALLLLFAGCASSLARTLEVGPGKAYAFPHQAADVAIDGDTVAIAAANYEGEVATWKANDLVLRGVSRYARLHAPADIPNGKAIWVIQGKRTTVENIEFYGAAVPDLNGAGIRQEGDGLVVRNCFFHDDEDGILGGGGAASEVVIENSEFAANGHGDGYSHNLYISNIASFTFRFCDTHHAKVGHDLKSRAQKNFILYNRIWDGAEGTASMEIDLPNGGTSYVIGNQIQQGPASENSTILNYGAEGLSNTGKDLYVVNNTFVNDRTGGGSFVSVASGGTAKIINNIFAGPGTAISGSADTAADWTGNDPGFLDRQGYDYRLADGSPAIDKGKDPGTAGGFSLLPVSQYVPNAQGMSRPAKGPLDIGAYEAGTAFPIAIRLGIRTVKAGRRYVLPVDLAGRVLPKRHSGGR